MLAGTMPTLLRNNDFNRLGALDGVPLGLLSDYNWGKLAGYPSLDDDGFGRL
jgi:hypothetical protein